MQEYDVWRGEARAIDWFVSRAGQFELITLAAAPVTGECGFRVGPAYVGCPPGTGPQIVFDPPVPLDQVIGDPLLTGTTATGSIERAGTSPARWQIRLDSAVPIDCTDDACAYEWLPGPSGSAVYLPYLDTPEGGNHLAAFVVDGRSIANGALLGRCDLVVGIVGNDVIGVQHVDGGQQLVAIDLTPLLG